MEGKNFSLFSVMKSTVFLQPKDHILFFPFAVLSQEQRKASEILVVRGSDYWVTLYLDIIITFPSKAT